MIYSCGHSQQALFYIHEEIITTLEHLESFILHLYDILRVGASDLVDEIELVDPLKTRHKRQAATKAASRKYICNYEDKNDIISFCALC